MTSQQHSPEPWQINDPSSFADRSAGTMIYAPYGNGHLLAVLEGCNQRNHLANAERILACVHACKGISNEELEAGVVANKKADPLSNSPYLAGDSCMLSQED